MVFANTHRSLVGTLLSFLFVFSFTFLLVVPLAWMGCQFKVGPITLAGCDTTKIHVVAADELELEKIACIRAVVTGNKTEEYALPKPAEGWPKEITEDLCLGSGTVTVTLTAYDDAGFLLALGSGQSTDQSEVNIEIQSKVPWS